MDTNSTAHVPDPPLMAAVTSYAPRARQSQSRASDCWASSVSHGPLCAKPQHVPW